MFTVCFSLSLSCINWFHYNSTHDAFRSIQKKFMLVRKRKKCFRILSHFLNATTTKSNIQRGQLSSVSYSKERFSLLFWFRNVPQPVFILPAKRTATSLVWLWFTTITREYNRLIFRAFCSFPSLSRVKLKS